MKRTLHFGKLLCFSFLFTCIFALRGQHHQDATRHESAKSSDNFIDEKHEVEAYIKHHLRDSHHFNFYKNPETGHHVGFPLPVILWTSKGLVSFMSSAFHHNDDGHYIVEKSGVRLVRVHGKIYELPKGENEVAFDEEHHPANVASVLNFSITKSVVGMLVAALLMIWLFVGLARSYRGGMPTGIGRFLEPMVLFVRDEIAVPNLGAKNAPRFLGFLLTIFFFILILNLLALTPLGFNVTGNLTVTFCFALFTFLIVQFSSNKNYWKHIFWMPGLHPIMKILLMPVEILGMFTKPFSLMLRLFANMTAGHIVLMSLISLMIVLKATLGGVGAFSISFLLTLLITAVELLVALLQAFIFTMLSSLFIGMAVADDHH